LFSVPLFSFTFCTCLTLISRILSLASPLLKWPFSHSPLNGIFYILD
jgi:hypothetical protein